MYRKLLFLAVVLAVGLTGCQHRGAIKAGDVSVRGVPDAGTPATLQTAKTSEKLELPKGSRIWLRQKPAVPAKPATATSPAVDGSPEENVTLIEPGDKTYWEKSGSSTKADTGTIDTSVTKHRIDVQDRKVLLWIALGCLVLGLVLKSAAPAWPGLSNGFLVAAPCAFGAWKLADVPSWAWVVCIVVMGVLALGYKRAEWDKNKDGIPDILQK